LRDETQQQITQQHNNDAISSREHQRWITGTGKRIVIAGLVGAGRGLVAGVVGGAVAGAAATGPLAGVGALPGAVIGGISGTFTGFATGLLTQAVLEAFGDADIGDGY
jgi:predicted phage tail protein